MSKIKFRLKLWAFKRIICSKDAWSIFNQASIPGFGTNLIRLYFPIYRSHLNGNDSFSPELKKQFSELFGAATAKTTILEGIDPIKRLVMDLPLKEKNSIEPYLDNYFFGAVDALVLGAMMNKHKPTQIIEIGSGISTRYMKLFKNHFNLNTKIVCIDPEPRSEISGATDILIKKPFESAIARNDLKLNPGDFLFMDGSHYVFQNNDTLSFFFKVLPSLPAGVIIHIHDIYLPYDYPENVTDQLWSEQYILAAMLLGGFKGFRVLLPTYYLSKVDMAFQAVTEEINRSFNERPFELRSKHNEGYSFWMEKI